MRNIILHPGLRANIPFCVLRCSYCFQIKKQIMELTFYITGAVVVALLILNRYAAWQVSKEEKNGSIDYSKDIRNL